MSAYDELIGELDPKHGVSPAPVSRAVFSDLYRGEAVSQAAAGFWIKYVARGSVAHSFGGRTFLVRAGEFLFSPQGLTSQVEVRSGGEPSTVGLCMFLAGGSAAPNPAEEPIVFPARCSALGRSLAARTAEIMRFGYAREQRAAGLVGQVEARLEDFLLDAAGQMQALGEMKPSTRHETLRRLQRARGHLHEVVHRPVELAELARAAGVSRFQLARQFKLCFGEAPGAYHRKLRLSLAKEAAARSGAPAGAVAQQFGFADASSFSHAYRRAFGCAPYRSGSTA